MELTVLTPEKEFFSGQVTAVKVPGTTGRFEVLENHAPIVSALTNGEVEITKANGERVRFNIARGFIEVLNNKVSVLAQVAAEAEE